MTFERVYDQALRWLARRNHSERELAAKLASRQATPAEIEAVLARCRELGYLDDHTLAEEYVASRLRSGRYGPQRVIADLQRKGVSRETIREVVTAAKEDLDLVTLARETLHRRFGEEPPTTEQGPREWRRRYDFLARRGFSPDTIALAMNKDFDG